MAKTHIKKVCFTVIFQQLTLFADHHDGVVILFLLRILRQFRIRANDSDFVLYLGRQALEVALMTAAPVLLTCAVVGVIVTLFQAVTSIRDMSLTVVPKLIAVGLVLMLFGAWMLDTMMRFMTDIFGYIQNVGH